jgi:hypothetical protein
VVRGDLSRARSFVKLGARGLLAALVALTCLAVLIVSDWSWSLVSWLIGVSFGLAALLLPGGIAIFVCLVTTAGVIVPVAARGGDPMHLVTLFGELGVAGIFAFAVRSSLHTIRRYRRTVRERDQDLANVHEAGQRLTRTMTADDLCREVARATRRITGAAYARLVVTSPDGRRIELVAASGQDGEQVVSGRRPWQFLRGIRSRTRTSLSRSSSTGSAAVSWSRPARAAARSRRSARCCCRSMRSRPRRR